MMYRAMTNEYGQRDSGVWYFYSAGQVRYKLYIQFETKNGEVGERNRRDQRNELSLLSPYELYTQYTKRTGSDSPTQERHPKRAK